MRKAASKSLRGPPSPERLLKEQIERLKDENRELKLFAFATAHDLKGPAIALYGLTRRLCRSHGDDLGPGGQACCEHILKASSQMAALVDKLNEYVTSREAKLIWEDVDLVDLIEELIDDYSEITGDRGIRILMPKGRPVIHADRLALVRVLRNLVENALKYGGSGLTEIRVEYAQDEYYHLVTVADNGVGLGQVEPDQLFSAFRRHHTSRGIKGSGLGLAIVREVARKHGGGLKLVRPPNGGAGFCVSLSKGMDEAETLISPSGSREER